jgi:hypothetical protein
MKVKGQTAMEYLMTYGWAILIVIVVVAALYSMGVFTLKGGVPCSPCFSYFAYIDHDATNLVIRNGPRQIDSVVVGTTTLTLTYNASDTITALHGCTTWPCTVIVSYRVTDSLTTHTDQGKLQSPG